MLCELHLRNLAVAEDVSLRLDPGLNVLTGSTGAGKSLVSEAVRWLRGEDIDRGVLRAGAESASAEATFDLHARPELVAQLRDRGVEIDRDDLLRLRREVRAGGRSRAWVDGRLASAALLQSIGEVLIQSQQQHLQLGLLDPRQHVRTLDALGVDPELVAGWDRTREDWQEAGRAIQAWTEQRERLLEQREVIEFQWRELDVAHLKGEELDPLRQRVSVMEGGARLMELAAAAQERLDDERHGAVAALQAALVQLRKAPAGVSGLQLASEALEGATELARDAQGHLESLLDGADLDPAEVALAQERLALLIDLTRKYGRTESELVRLRDRLSEQLDGLGRDDALPAALAAAHERTTARLDAAGRALHAARKRVALRCTADAAPLLEELGMVGAQLQWEFAPEPAADGPVRIEGRQVTALASGPALVTLLAQTNPGERPSPVHRGASGGELSRIALILRSLALRGQAPALLLLDEVDAGIGADLAPAIARRLAALAEGGQLLVITHQARIAADADRHLVVHKATDDERAVSTVHELDSKGRIDELVRMLGTDTAETRKVARGLLRREASA